VQNFIIYVAVLTLLFACRNSTANISRNIDSILSERVERLEDKASFIVSIPRLTIQERKDLMHLFIDKYDSLNKDELQTIIAAENGRTDLDFNAILLPEVNEDWRRFKYNYIHEN
jgi:uncharacterized protein UPF0158